MLITSISQELAVTLLYQFVVHLCSMFTSFDYQFLSVSLYYHRVIFWKFLQWEFITYYDTLSFTFVEWNISSSFCQTPERNQRSNEALPSMQSSSSFVEFIELLSHRAPSTCKSFRTQVFTASHVLEKTA